jgi:peptidylprolyl isomerase
VVDEGDGPVLQKGDKVLTNFAVSTDVGQDISYETYDKMGVLVDVGSTAQPKQIVDLMTGLINKHIEPGTTRVGTRIAMAVNATKEFGDLALNLSSFGIGNEDGFVLVADLEAVPLDGPKGSAKAAPSWAPKITEKKGEPASLDSSAQPQPDPTSKQLAKAVLIQGTGPVVQKGDQIVANYIGQVYKGKAPFDSSYTRPDPAVFSIGTGNVVKGWDQGLVGAKVGSRVLLRVPPALGYGKKGNGDTIPANSTLYFVVDILAAG